MASPCQRLPRCFAGQCCLDVSSVLCVESAQQIQGTPKAEPFPAPAEMANPLCGCSCTQSIPSVLRSWHCFPCPMLGPCTELPGLFWVSSAVQELRTLWCTQTSLLLQVSQSISSSSTSQMCCRHPVCAQAAHEILGN